MVQGEFYYQQQEFECEALHTISKCLTPWYAERLSEGLHRASRKLREMWISENTIRAAKRMAVLQDEDASMAPKQIRLCEGKERNPRNADQDKESLNWIPYVHFRI